MNVVRSLCRWAHPVHPSSSCLARPHSHHQIRNSTPSHRSFLPCRTFAQDANASSSSSTTSNSEIDKITRFLKRHKLDEHATKFTSWAQLMNAETRWMRQQNIPTKARRLLLREIERYQYKQRVHAMCTAWKKHGIRDLQLLGQVVNERTPQYLAVESTRTYPPPMPRSEPWNQEMEMTRNPFAYANPDPSKLPDPESPLTRLDTDEFAEDEPDSHQKDLEYDPDNYYIDPQTGAWYLKSEVFEQANQLEEELNEYEEEEGGAEEDQDLDLDDDEFDDLDQDLDDDHDLDFKSKNSNRGRQQRGRRNGGREKDLDDELDEV